MGKDIVKAAFAAEVCLEHLLNEKLENYEVTPLSRLLKPLVKTRITATNPSYLPTIAMFFPS